MNVKSWDWWTGKEWKASRGMGFALMKAGVGLILGAILAVIVVAALAGH